MKETKEKNNCKGITLVSLIVTIVVMLIVISITGNVSYERFKINKFNKMKNDIELLSDKVNNYYLTYNEIPVVKEGENNLVKYEYTTLNFSKNVNDNENYYIINLSAMKDISLNYGKEGFENLNKSVSFSCYSNSKSTIEYGSKVTDTLPLRTGSSLDTFMWEPSVIRLLHFAVAPGTELTAQCLRHEFFSCHKLVKVVYYLVYAVSVDIEFTCTVYRVEYLCRGNVVELVLVFSSVTGCEGVGKNFVFSVCLFCLARHCNKKHIYIELSEALCVNNTVVGGLLYNKLRAFSRKKELFL